jgi:protein-disulfide isomerase
MLTASVALTLFVFNNHMRYFWHFVIAISVIGFIFFVFFASSLRFGNSITYTDQKTITTPTVTFIDPILGKNDAAVTMVVFGDYECTACQDLDRTTLDLIADDFPNDLRIVWKDMPNTSQHPESLNAAIAARCAHDQGKFWEYHTALMETTAPFAADLYTTLAANLNLKERSFSSCIAEQTPAPIIQGTYEEGLALGVASTPTVFINGERYTGALDKGTLKVIIRQALTQ